MPVHRLVVRNGDLAEQYVGIDGDGFRWIEGDVSAEAEDMRANILPMGLPEGSLLDVSPAAGNWFADAAGQVERGFAMVIDYGYEAEELYAQHRLEGTVRGYRGHIRDR